MAIDIIKRQDQLILSQITFCLDIDSWKRYKSEVPLKWKFVKFEKNNRDEIPESSGVYGFFIKPSVAGFGASGKSVAKRIPLTGCYHHMIKSGCAA